MSRKDEFRGLTPRQIESAERLLKAAEGIPGPVLCRVLTDLLPGRIFTGCGKLYIAAMYARESRPTDPQLAGPLRKLDLGELPALLKREVERLAARRTQVEQASEQQALRLKERFEAQERRRRAADRWEMLEQNPYLVVDLGALAGTLDKLLAKKAQPV